MKLLERVLDSYIRKMVNIDEMQFGFVPGRGTTDAIFIASEEFDVGVGVHQGSVLSPLLFILVLEALSRVFRRGTPWELLYADDLVVIADSLDECVARLKAWKTGMESMGLRVNMPKTKCLVSGVGLDVLKNSGKFPCAVCRSGVGANAIKCTTCKLWVHKRCCGIKSNLGRLSADQPG